MPRRPHYLLHARAEAAAEQARWTFTLREVGSAEGVTVSERECDTELERVELLSVVRGLEALPEPAQVTLLTASETVRGGIRFGLDEWRANEWRWEAFGEFVPINHLDLWRRIDRALSYHDVDVRRWRGDAPVVEQSNTRNADSTVAPHCIARVVGDSTAEAEPVAGTRRVLQQPRRVPRQAAVARSARGTISTIITNPHKPLSIEAGSPAQRSRHGNFSRVIHRIQLRLLRRLRELIDSVGWFWRQLVPPSNDPRWLENCIKERRSAGSYRIAGKNHPD